MNYPVWELDLGHGPMMALVAVVHTFVSQFAIGAGLLLVVTETFARRRGDEALLGWLRRNTRAFVLLSLVFGALSGVAIWFVIGLVNPQGTSALIHAFVWGWAIEWVFFFVEIAAALVYLYGWDRLSPKRHLAVGWIYFAAAWLSLAVIGGILSFMLTPGKWLETHDFWDGFLNPTYVPSVVMRTGVCLALAGGFAHLAVAREKDAALRPRVARIAAAWTLGGIVIATASAFWYWDVAVAETAATAGPSDVERVAQGSVSAAAEALSILPWCVAAAGLLALLGVVLPRTVRWPTAILLLLALFASLGAFEWLREGARKPWIVRGYLRVDGSAAAEEGPIEGGIASVSPWLRHADPADGDLAEAGEDLFRVSCRPCHTVDGYRSIRPLVAGHSAEWLSQAVARLERMRGPMPPFRGNAAERKALGHWLGAMTKVEEITYADAGIDAAGERVYERDCAPCHGDVRGVARIFQGFEPEDVLDWIESIEGMFEDKMPSFHGTDRERDALAAYLAKAGSDAGGTK